MWRGADETGRALDTRATLAPVQSSDQANCWKVFNTKPIHRTREVAFFANEKIAMQSRKMKKKRSINKRIKQIKKHRKAR